MMNRFREMAGQTLVCIILSLSTTAIYAEVPTKAAEQSGAVKGAAANGGTVKADRVPAQDIPPVSPATVTTGWELHAEQWELARSGETLLSLPALNQVITAWLSDKKKMIEIQYPGGEDGEFWVQELTDWLVSLGIPSKFMIITPGSGADDVIKFNIVK